MKTIFALIFLFLANFIYGQEPATKVDTHQIYDIVDVDAEFPGGYDALNKFIRDNINLNEVIEFSEKELNNRVFVQFVVNKEGLVEDIKIMKATTHCPPCNKEAIRLIASMPQWKPGMVNGKAVSMHFTLPLIFAVQ
ncbi:MAG: energy transducer TonB [Flavobacteriales bacterium]